MIEDQAALNDWLVREGHLSPGAAWSRLAGGRSNHVWRVSGPGAPSRIVKLHRPAGATPLYPNDAAAEIAALRHLSGRSLAPALLAHVSSPWGTVLILEALPGEPATDPAEVLRALRVLHDIPAPEGLRALCLDAGRFAQEGHDMMRAAPGDLVRRLARGRPAHRPPARAAESVFLHGDPVPANALVHAGCVSFVDWQCPAHGDPVFDIACALSPSMRLSCGAPPLDEAHLADALAAYGRPGIAEAYRLWRPWLTWRFACYAAWRIADGSGDYAAGLAAELSLLEDLGQ